MKEVLKEEMNKYLIKKPMKTQRELMKETQTEGNLEMENLGAQTRASEARRSSRKQDIKERSSGTEDRIEDIPLSENMLNLKNSRYKIPGNLGHYEKQKQSKNNRNRERRRNPHQRKREYFHRGKFFYS